MNCHGHDVHASGLRPRLTLVLSVLVAALLSLIPWSGTAVAHGSVVDPASRNYGCWLRWGSDFQNPEMARLDPMCWQGTPYRCCRRASRRSHRARRRRWSGSGRRRC
ncbi:hypothetical protein ABZ281_37080, partial [Streptomyces sp. NPDC006265]